MILKNGVVFTKDYKLERLDIRIDNGIITEISDSLSSDKDMIDCTGCYILPSLTDVHLHGCCGHDMCDASAESIEEIARYEFSCGVTQIFPATMTVADDRLERILASAAEYNRYPAKNNTAIIAGIHLEGPFISEKMAGAQRKELIQPPSYEKLLRWFDRSDGLIRLVTIAPETDGAIDLIKRAKNIFHFSLGHTMCTYKQASDAFYAGADHVTHLFNAMPQLHHRETGLIGAAADSDCFAELICDGVHLSPAAVRLAFRMFGDDRIVLISDSMEAAGLPDGSYSLGGQTVIKNGKRAELKDGTLAGSVSTLYDCMVNAVKFGIPLISAVKAAAVNPCRSAGIYDKYGCIDTGRKASVIITDMSDLSLRTVIA
ncbi:MAG: N-acetylglucosamine-6-phosphate deacetylase [Ruminococcus sp.]|nr:N-acetylglucosamine-6-phosphate deacetylase [Ruminococcus sp.]